MRVRGVALTALLVAVGAIATADDLVTYQDPGGRFSLEYPKAWHAAADTANAGQQVFLFSAHPLTAATTRLEDGLALIVVANSQPGVLSQQNLAAAGGAVRDGLQKELEGADGKITWTTAELVDWGGTQAQRSAGSITQAGQTSDIELLVTFSPKWVFAAVLSRADPQLAPQVGQVRDAVRLAAAAAPPEAAAGQIPPIVFVRRNAGENAGSDLWLYDAATMQTRQLTHLSAETANGKPVRVEHPAWSPDHSRIAFASTYHADQNAYPMNVFTIARDGSDLRQVTFLPPAASGATCTVTGTVVYRDGKARPLGAVRVTAAGAPGAAMTDEAGHFKLTGVPASNAWVALWAQEGDTATRGFGGENPSTLLWPALKPGEANDLGTVELRNVAGAYLSRTYLTEPSWTADGKALLFTRRTEYTGRYGQPHLMTMNDPEWIQRFGYNDPNTMNPWQPRSEMTGGVVCVLWKSQVFAVQADGSQLRPVTPVFLSDGASPRASADGTQAYVKTWQNDSERVGLDNPFVYQGDADVSTIVLAGGAREVAKLPARLERHGGLAMSPDGRSLAYVRFGPATKPAPDPETDKLFAGLGINGVLSAGTAWGPVAVLDLQTGQERVVDFFPGVNRYIADLCFTPDSSGLVFTVNEYKSINSKYMDPPDATDIYLGLLATGQAGQLTHDGLSCEPSW